MDVSPLTSPSQVAARRASALAQKDDIVVQPYDLTQLELRHLLALQAVARSGTFWGAAEDMGCSQSALSQQIAAMERLLGVTLIDRHRGKRTVSTTEAGRLLLRHAEVIVARMRAVRADFTAFTQGAAGTLRVGTFESSGTHLLPPLLREFRNRWPAVEVKLTELSKDDQLLRLVEQGDLDLSFAILPLPAGPFESQILLEDPYMLVVSRTATFPGIKPNSVRLSRIKGMPVIGFGQGRSMEQAESQIKSQGIELNIVFRSNYNGVVQGLVGAGVGCAIAPRLTLDLRRTDTRVLGPIKDLQPRLIAMAWHKDRYRTPAAAAFIDVARRISEGLQTAHQRQKRRG
ncbi:LysR family transcriptional regulator [bacterium]|nr:MAG: LysR family transcriptional regulator [bacterium]